MKAQGFKILCSPCAKGGFDEAEVNAQVTILKGLSKMGGKGAVEDDSLFAINGLTLDYLWRMEYWIVREGHFPINMFYTQ